MIEKIEGNALDAALFRARSGAPRSYVSGLEGGAAFHRELLALATLLKRLDRQALTRRAPLFGKTFTGLFLNPSLRTRTSFEVGMNRLGGHMVTLSPGADAWAMEFGQGVVMDGGCAEHIIEAAGVLSGYTDLLGMRAFAAMRDFEAEMQDQAIRMLVAHSSAPVISLESAMWHPCQALADALTLKEHFGAKLAGKRFTLTWAKHPRMCGVAVPHSTLTMAARLGMHVTLAHPAGYDLHPDVIASATQLASESGGSLSFSDDIDQACDSADVVYAKAWGAPQDYGHPEMGCARNMNHAHWTVDVQKLGGAQFMHCLPIRRNVVATDGVLDGAQSLVQTQANNRLWAQMALLLAMMP